MADDIIVNASSLEGFASTQTINASVRSLRAFKIDFSGDFTINPESVKDIKGAETKSGILSIGKQVPYEADGKTKFKFVECGKEEATHAKYVNPKDSSDKYAEQVISGSNGVLILPGKDEAQVAEINAVVDKIIGSKETITIAEFDAVLKAAHAFYVGKGEAPDIYNSDVSQLDAAKHIKIGNNSFQKVAKAETMYFIEAPADKSVGFVGSATTDGHLASAQYSTGSFVVITGTDAKTQQPYSRKLDKDYAEHNLRDAKTGQKLDFETLPKVKLEDILAKQGAAPDATAEKADGTQAGQGASTERAVG